PRRRTFTRRSDWTGCSEASLTQLCYADAVRLGGVARRFLAAGQRLGDFPKTLALARKYLEFLQFVRLPRLTVAFEFLGHQNGTSSSDTAFVAASLPAAALFAGGFFAAAFFAGSF